MTIAPRILALLLGVSLFSCDKKKDFGIEYQESSPEQTAEATAAAFAESARKVEVEPEIDAFFTRMGKASRSTDTMDADECISIEAMMETAEAAGMLEGLSASEKQSFRKGFVQGAVQLAPAIRQMGYDRHRVVRVEKPSESHRIVFAGMSLRSLKLLVAG